MHERQLTFAVAALRALGRLWLGWLAASVAASPGTDPISVSSIRPAARQGTTFQIRLGGQGLDGVNEVAVSGKGVSAKVVEYHRRLNNEEMNVAEASNSPN